MSDEWNDLRERYALVSTDFLGLVGQLDEQTATRGGVCGVWSVKAIVAHRAAWDWEVERRFREFHAEDAEDRRYDVDAFNAAAVDERRDLTWEETLDELRRANMTFAAALANVSEADRAADPRYQQWLVASTEDYAAHTAQIREWLAAQEAS